MKRVVITTLMVCLVILLILALFGAGIGPIELAILFGVGILVVVFVARRDRSSW